MRRERSADASARAGRELRGTRARARETRERRIASHSPRAEASRSMDEQSATKRRAAMALFFLQKFMVMLVLRRGWQVRSIESGERLRELFAGGGRRFARLICVHRSCQFFRGRGSRTLSSPPLHRGVTLNFSPGPIFPVHFSSYNGCLFPKLQKR